MNIRLPAVSIIIPVYNTENYLSACIDSVLASTLQDIEVILVDDGSKDSSGEICDQFASKDNRVKAIHTKNQGVSIARNTGLANASGEYIGFCDSDDTIQPIMYELLYSVAHSCEADIVTCISNRMSEDGIIIKTTPRDQQDYSGEDAIEKLFTGYIGLGVVSKIYKRQLLNDVYFDSKRAVSEDLLFNYQVFRKAQTIVATGQPLYNYRGRSGSASRTFSKKTYDMVTVSEDIYKDCLRRGNLIAPSMKRFISALVSYYNASLLNEKRSNYRLEIRNKLKRVLKDNKVHWTEMKKEYMLCYAPVLYDAMRFVYSKYK